ncbi:hypothetical protein OG921_22760 [Aldersonia sp. NBC_00410]|uniref:hypothetical protein n=1 Tax=Aldersonia sp. NBC_00410 TaxID=2975954 RepID=UPI002259F4EA|nr:hypothetical protein [Aldersonia sp. NBC_00410]MCX5045996.1 hypothetical protein [Aldersonia sp. NBC_00410]
MVRTIGGLVVGVLGVGMWIGSTAPAAAEPVTFDGATTLQVPGVIVGLPITRGAAPYTPTIEHGHGRIHPVRQGYGWTYTWVNLSTGGSGTITEQQPTDAATTTGSGQVVVTASVRIPDLGEVIVTPSVGTFFVTP